MRRAAAIVIIAAVCALPGVGHSAVTRYTITNLGFHDAGGVWINDSGKVAGRSGLGMPDYLFDHGSLLSLGSFRVSGINNQCQIAGSFNDRAAIWQNGNAVQLPTPAGGFLGHSSASSVNDRGDAIGSYDIYDDSWHYLHSGSFLWQDGAIGNIPTLGGSFLDINAINNHGHVVGCSSLSGESALHAFVYADGLVTDLGVLPNHTDGLRDSSNHSEAKLINDVGTVLGLAWVRDYYWDPLWMQYREYTVTAEFVYRDGQMTEFPGLPQCLGNFISGLNDMDQVVGHSRYADRLSAWLWQDGQIVDLDGLVDPGSGWVINTANDINNSGQIVGVGTFNGIYGYHYLLTPVPEPSAFLATVVGFAGFGVLLRRGQWKLPMPPPRDAAFRHWGCLGCSCSRAKRRCRSRLRRSRHHLPLCDQSPAARGRTPGTARMG